MKEDKRIIQTKQRIENTLIELLRNKYLGEITVKELCEKANINRSTFYVYYSSPSDVYKVIEENAINKINIFLDCLNNNITLYNFFYDVISFLVSNKNVFIVMTKESVILKNTIINSFTKRFTLLNLDINYLYEFLFFGFINVINKWFEKNQLETIDELATFFEKYFSQFFMKAN